MIGVAFRAVSAIGRERDQQTMDSLLLLPVERREILAAKWLGSLLRLRWLAASVVTVWAFAILIGALHPFALPLVALAAIVHVSFFASLGTWIALVSRTTLSANMTMALLTLITFLGSWLTMLYNDAP